MKELVKSTLTKIINRTKEWKALLSASVWPEKSIVYYTGKTAEEWTPDSLKRGLAGSQTAVIYLGREWVKLGYQVTVYSNCGNQEGIYDGVEYRNYNRFNQYDTFDILILWRSKTLPMLDLPLKAKKILLELHDVPYQVQEFTPERLDKVDKIFVKGNFHRSFLPGIPKEKFATVSNGIDKSLIHFKEHEKDPYKLIYASNYDRGLELMLTYGWSIIKQEIPEAHLHVYYGWNFFDESFKRNPERQAWKQKMIELMSQPGVTDHGRIGQDKLIEEKSTSSIHYYGCTYQEIDCISVRESAMVGCVPVTTDFAALAEKSYCFKVSGNPTEPETQEAIAKKIVELLKDREQLSRIRQQFRELVGNETWDRIAQVWVESGFPNKGLSK